MLKTVAVMFSIPNYHAKFYEGNNKPVESVFIHLANPIAQGGQRTVSVTPTNLSQRQEAISDYVAELQLHMTLQARNLVPTLSQTQGGCNQLVHESQAMVEKIVSRQSR